MSTEQQEQINAALKDFQDNPQAFMDRLPGRSDARGEQASGKSAFDRAAIDNKDYITARDSLRQKLTDLDEIAPGRQAFAENDQADGFVDTFRYSGLESMEANNLMEAGLGEQPWSDDYWAIYLGMLGKRYADPGFPKSEDWKENFEYIRNNPVAAVLQSGNAEAVNRLSPSEKYSILIGDRNDTLTKQMWEQGKEYYVRHGRVETWMGLCHGWAPAAYMLPRPTGTATVLAADGRTLLTFYPSDIKALATLLWANAETRSRFIGGRCNDKNPPTDPDSGRTLSQKCFDTNPGTWHLAAVNQIACSGRSMVMDATYDYQVWNQPVVSYRYRYFNPKQMRYVRSLAEARMAVASFSEDRFAKYRSSETDSIVGIVMDVCYTVETDPSHKETDGPADDGVDKVRYFYDLELDFAGNIIGGEWYQNTHPDFLWNPVPGERALTYWEREYALQGNWQSDRPMPEQWRQVAAMTGEYQAAPLAAVVERLIAFSRS